MAKKPYTPISMDQFNAPTEKCDRCEREVEIGCLVNIAYSMPYDYNICGACSNKISRRMRRLILNEIINKIKEDMK